MKIAITKSNSGFAYYLNWLKFFKLDYVIFDWKDKNSINMFEDCSGLILTGGTDIYPGLYSVCKNSDSDVLFTKERDEYEMNLIDIALNKKKPVLGICRGSQILNVYFKGNLISDLEEVKGVNHRKISDSEVRIHNVNIENETMLSEILKLKSGSVTSTHHQAVDKTGEGLIVNAFSDDGVIEGIEYKNKEDNSFLLGIQWHPERFDDYSNPFSKNILEQFIRECKNI
jgi:putative glutamine amidotransferase